MDAGNRSTGRDPRRLAPQSVRRLRDVLGRNAPAFVRALQADLSFMLAAAGPTFGPLRLPGVALLEYDRA